MHKPEHHKSLAMNLLLQESIALTEDLLGTYAASGVVTTQGLFRLSAYQASMCAMTRTYLRPRYQKPCATPDPSGE